MTEKTKTTVVIESHQQTVIRRSRRTITTQTTEAPIDITIEEPPKPLSRWWKRIALKGATVLAPLSRRLRASADRRKHRLGAGHQLSTERQRSNNQEERTK